MATSDSTLDNLPPSAQLALLHAQAATNDVQDPFVPSPDDPVLDNSSYEPLIAGDYPTPIGKPITPIIKKETVSKKNLDLNSESAFPSLSATPRAPVNTGWSSTSRVKSPQTNASRPMAPPATGKKSTNNGAQITDVFKLSANSQIANMPNKPLGFKSNADVIQQVIKKTSTNIIASTNRSGTTTFIIQGSPNDVSKAKKELIAGLVVKRTVEVVVPASMRRFIIGPKGSTLGQIEAKSYTRINFPRKDDEDAINEDDDTVVVTIMGDASGIKVAKEEIEKIVGDKIGKQTIKVDGFDSKYYLFLAGNGNSNIKKLEDEFDVKVYIPAVIVDGTTNTDTTISISGDKDKVQAAKQALEKLYTDVENTSRTISISIPKRQHKYLYGKNGDELKSIYNASGCTVELPSAEDPSDNVTIRGLEPDLVKGLTAVMEKANAVQVTVLNLSDNYKASGKDALKNAQAALKYLVHKKSFKKVEDEHNVMVCIPQEEEVKKSVVLEFVSSSGKDAALAQLAVSNLLRDLTTDIFAFVDIKTYLHHHIASKHRSTVDRIQSNNQVTILFPNEKEETSSVLVVYSGNDKSATKASLDAASAELVKIAAESSDYISKNVSIPNNLHDLIRGPKGTTLNAIIGETDVVVRFGVKDKVEVRGLTKDVNLVIDQLQKASKVVQEEDYTKPYSAEFFVSSSFSAHIIGKSGANINKLKDDLGVKVDIGENEKSEEVVVSKKKNNTVTSVKVVIQGPKINVNAAQERIQAQISSLADQTTLTLKVPKAFHRYLIGPSGRYVKKLEDKYNVHIKFPRSGSNRGDESPSTPTNPDEISVRGSKKDANAAKDELLELYEYEKEEQEKRKEREQKHKEYEEKRAAEDKRRAEERAAREAREAAKEAAREAKKAEREAAKKD